MTTLLRAISAGLLLCATATVNADIESLKLGIRTTYPADVKTVGQGAQWLLEDTGYRLVVAAPAPSDASLLASKPIPPMARLPRTMTIEDALLALVGPGNYLIIDRKNRLVSFTTEAE